jgi:hypothetical protein
MQHYVTAIPNPGLTGPRPELYTKSPDARQRFIEKWDRVGYSVYECINPLVDGARKRAQWTVARLEHIVLDIDFKDLDETVARVDAIVAYLPLRPSEVRDSGHGRHVLFELDEPPANSTPEFEELCGLWKRLAYELGADPAVTTPHGLIRCVGTLNSKFEPHVRCQTITWDVRHGRA